MTGKYLLDVLVASGFLTKVANRLGLSTKTGLRDGSALSQGMTNAVVWQPTVFLLSRARVDTNWKHLRDGPSHCWLDSCETAS